VAAAIRSLQQDLGSDFERPASLISVSTRGIPATILDVADLGPVQTAAGRELFLGEAEAAA